MDSEKPTENSFISSITLLPQNIYLGAVNETNDDPITLTISITEIIALVMSSENLAKNSTPFNPPT